MQLVKVRLSGDVTFDFDNHIVIVAIAPYVVSAERLVMKTQ